MPAREVAVEEPLPGPERPGERGRCMIEQLVEGSSSWAANRGAVRELAIVVDVGRSDGWLRPWSPMLRLLPVSPPLTQGLDLRKAPQLMVMQPTDPETKLIR